MSPTNPNPTDVPTPADDQRLPYEPPRLVDLGQVGELTKSIGSNFGSDGIYS